MKKILTIIIILLSNQLSFAQFSLSVEFLPTDKLIENSCIDSNIVMQAIISNSASFDKTKANFTWYFGDGSQESELALDHVTHSYSKGGGYYVLLKVVDEFDTIRFARKQIQVGLKPDFTETKANTENSICLGDRVILSSKISQNSWKYNYLENIVFEEEYQIADNYPEYAQSITFLSFAENAKLEKIIDLKNIGLNIEHSASSDLEIRIKCPNETVVTLKSQGGTAAKMGIPLLDPSISVGTTSNYSWNSPAPTFSTMAIEAGSNTTLAAGSYTSSENLDALLGCPLNGQWTLFVTDYQAGNNGFIASWGIEFDAALITPAWEFANTYNKNTLTWLGTGVGIPTNLNEANSFTSTVFSTPEEYGSTIYTFSVENDFACPCDTSINIRVTSPDFTFDPMGGEAPIEINFTSNTDWGSSFEWLFGDEIGTSFDENPVYTYQAEKDTSYKILFTAFSESMCKDTVSEIIYIKVPNSEIDLPNVFTPNNDGNNDLWIIKPKAQGKELPDVFAELDCRIYNRFGRMVCRFKTPDEAKNGWDGTLNNNGNTYVSEGVYFYRIISKGKDGKELEKEFQQGIIHVYR